MDSAFAFDSVAANALLDRLELAWQPIVARDRRAVGIRLALKAVPPMSAAALADGLIEASPLVGGLPQGLLVLAPGGGLDAGRAMLAAPRNVLLEVPDGVTDAEWSTLIELQRHGVRLVARASGNLSQARARLFSYVVQSAEDLTQACPRAPDPLLWARDVGSLAAVDAALAAGASAVVGWPLEGRARQSEGLHPEQRAVLDLIRLVQRDAEVGELEAAFRLEPVLAYMLLTLVNSPAFARAVPLASIGYAIQMLGYRRIVRWLVLLLVVAGKDSHSLPLVHQTVARGFLLENLGRLAGRLPGECDELFIVGAFSLLDHITGQSFEHLLQSSLLPPAVIAAIASRDGDYGALLQIAERFEGEAAIDIAPAAARAGLSRGQANRALLEALLA
ncbi:MAG: HDOD domain-containing protein, partial [Burkholderiaceae bacterium]